MARNVSIPLSAFNADNILIKEVQEKQIPKSKNKYTEIPIRYRLAEGDTTECMVALPTTLARFGVKKVETPDGGYGYLIDYSLDTEEKEALAVHIDALYQKIVDFAWDNRKALGLRTITNKDQITALFRNPIYTNEDPDKNFPPSLGIKLVPRYSVMSRVKDTKGNLARVDWTKLESIPVLYTPVVHIQKVYCNGMMLRLQIKLRSAIVEDTPEDNPAKEFQADTIARVAKNEDRNKALGEKFDAIMGDKPIDKSASEEENLGEMEPAEAPEEPVKEPVSSRAHFTKNAPKRN